MTKPDATALLRERIAQLEVQQKRDAELLSEQFYTTLDQLRPANLIKNAVGKLLENTEVTPSIVASVIPGVVNFLARTLLGNWEDNPFKKMLVLGSEILLTAFLTRKVQNVGRYLALLLSSLVGNSSENNTETEL